MNIEPVFLLAFLSVFITTSSPNGSREGFEMRPEACPSSSFALQNSLSGPKGPQIGIWSPKSGKVNPKGSQKEQTHH